MRTPAVVALTFAAACAAPEHGEATSAIVYDACAPLAVGGDMTDAQTRGLDDAIALWRGTGVMAPTRDAGAAKIELVFQTAGSPFHGQYDGASTIYVNRDLSGDALAIVIAHELGHALGLEHTTAYRSVMRPGNLDTVPQPADRDALVALWGNCQ